MDDDTTLPPVTDHTNPFLSLPQIGKLLAWDRRRVWERARSGAFGELLQVGRSSRIRLSDLHRCGFGPFSLEQIRIVKSRYYTEAQVSAAIEEALAERERLWADWLANPTQRRAFPQGPA